MGRKFKKKKVKKILKPITEGKYLIAEKIKIKITTSGNRVG